MLFYSEMSPVILWSYGKSDHSEVITFEATVSDKVTGVCHIIFEYTIN